MKADAFSVSRSMADHARRGPASLPPSPAERAGSARGSVHKVMSALLVAGVALSVSACDAPKGESGAASASVSAKPAPPPKPAKRTTMPELLIDEMGPYFDGRRADVSKAAGKAKLKSILKELPIDGKRVTLRVLKKAKVPWVAEAVWQLGEAGAPEVLIKTDGRGDLPKELLVVPESRLGGTPDPCTVAIMVTDSLAIGVWPFKGGGGTRSNKGMAGPDLSKAAIGLEKVLKRCKSTTAFFSGSEKHTWENAYNVGALLHITDKEKKIQSLVLLHNEPVAGRKVKLSK